MTLARVLGTACAASLLLAGTALAAPVAPIASRIDAPMTSVAMLMKGTPAAKMKQRSRTRTTRCNKTPSRC